MKRELEEGEQEDEEAEASKKARSAESEEVAVAAEPSIAAGDAADDAPSTAAEVSGEEAAVPEAGVNGEETSSTTAAASSYASDAPLFDAAATAPYVPAPPPAAPYVPALPQAALSDEELVRLLQARADAKSRREFTTADSIRATLLQNGISIIDGRNAGGMGTWSSADGRRGNTLGPDFFLDPNAAQVNSTETPPGATISNEDLVAQLRARAEAKNRRDFSTSDSIRAALEAHGIRITDSSRSWVSTDGRSGNTSGPDFLSSTTAPSNPSMHTPYGYGAPPPPANPYGGFQPPPPAYSAPPPPGPPAASGSMPTEVILAKLGERESARIAKDYTRSDVMRDELMKGGVRVDDRLKTWTCNDGRSGTITRPERGGGTCYAGGGGGGGSYSQPPQPAASQYGQDQQYQQAAYQQYQQTDDQQRQHAAAWAAYYQAQGQYWPQYPS